MAHLGEYTFLVTNLITRKVIDEVELSSLHWEEIYNKPGAGRATARIHHPKVTESNFASWFNGLWAIKDGDLRFGGFLGPVQPRAGTGVIEIPVFGFMEYYRERVIRDSTGMTNVTFSGNDLKWTQKDQFLIAQDVINHVNAEYGARGDIGVTAVWDALSGILKDETIHTYEHKYAGEWFDGFASREDGFGWFTEYYYDGDDPRSRVRLQHPRAGRDTEFELFYSEGDEASNILEYDIDGGQRPITGALHLEGAGEGDDMLHLHITNSTTEMAYDDVLAYKDISLSGTLFQKGKYHMQTRNRRMRQFTIEIDFSHDASPHYTEFRPGDEMRVVINDGYVQVDRVCTCVAKQVVLSEEHDEIVKVTMLEAALL